MHSALLFLTLTNGLQAEIQKAIKQDSNPDNKQRLFID